MPVRMFENIAPVIDETVYVDPGAVVIGKVTIGKDSSIWPFSLVRGDVNMIQIGARTNIQDHSVLHVAHQGKFNPAGGPLIIGNDVTVGHRCTLHACTIGDFSLIGMGAIILDNAVIESNVIIGAASLVPPNKVLKSGYLYLGQPAKAIRLLTESELEFLAYSADYYAKLKDKYLC